MLVFSTRLPLKDTTASEDCIRTIMDWIIESPHYPFHEIEYNPASHKDFDLVGDSVTLSFRYYKNEEVELHACRLDNRNSGAVWLFDCVILNEQGKKSILIQLNRSRIAYGTRLPHTRKPALIQRFIDGGFCADDGGIPVTDTPLPIEDLHYTACSDIMNGTHPSKMPSVYISRYPDGTLAVDPIFLARQLGGVAHVFVEDDRETSLALRADTDGNNAHSGYVGLYFPRSRFVQKFAADYYENVREMEREIITAVWNALISRTDSSWYNWHQISALQARQKMSEWQNINSQNREDLNAFIELFEQEQEEFRQQIENATQLYYAQCAVSESLRAQLRARGGGGGEDAFFKTGPEKTLYPSERNDLLYSLLSQALTRYPEGSRGHALISSMLQANPRDGECGRITQGVRDIFFHGGELNRETKATLNRLGFTIDGSGTHYKLIFHDPRYTFFTAKTPSDHRSGKNMISDICRIIDVERKI